VILPGRPEDPPRAAWLTDERRTAWEAWVVDGPDGGAGTQAYDVEWAAGEPAEQGTLFPDSALADSHGVTDHLLGYRGPVACQVAGITYRQLDYWARTNLVVPSIRGASGSGSQRLYSFKDILVLKVVKRLLDTGVSLQNIRVAVEHLRRRGVGDLARITLFSDGTTVYECTSPEEVVDLLQGGQGVFGIAVSSPRSGPMAATSRRLRKTS
jgi:DNA-binding transcriptional MerR regulator